MNEGDWEKEAETNRKAKLEFAKKELELKTGYLILIDGKISHYLNKKDWEKDKETEEYKQKYPQGQISAATNLDLWHEWLRGRDRK